MLFVCVFQKRGPDRRKKPYDRDVLRRAYQATLGGTSVYRAARLYGVPEQTLRDRAQHKIGVDCKLGSPKMFTLEEEKALVDHIIYMGNIGYGYSMIDMRCMAAEYGRSLGKDVKAKAELSGHWFYRFMKRWDKLKSVKPQKLGLPRAKTASKETIDEYFHELGHVLTTHGLLGAPDHIWNIDESGFSTEHSPPKIVCSRDTKAQAVTSPRTKNVTLIGGINAMGNHIPPYYIFPGKQWDDCFIEGAVAGAVGKMTDSGWVNRGIFEDYIINHLARYAGIQRGEDRPATLILYDGHKSHLSLTLTTWAKERNVILFVLPPHSSHLTQPLDVGVFGPMKAFFNRECRGYMHANPGLSITTRDIARLTAKPFLKAFSAENITSAFKRSGIYPFCSAEISEEATAPATIYPKASEETDVPQQSQPKQVEKAASFLDSITITTVVQRPRKKFQTPVRIVGNLTTDANVGTLQLQEKRREVVEAKKSKKVETKKKRPASPKPSTSGVCNSRGKALPAEDEDSSSDSEAGDGELCCVCKKSTPAELRDCISIVFVKWGQCDVCGHWVHLQFCTKVRVLRRGSFFRCPHCPDV